jgi:nitrite reductase/ring-hydroxylating ferredoxin subunit
VNRNFLGPEHRYARAGKWREQHLDGRPGESLRVCRVDELEVDQMRLLHIGGKRIVLARSEKGYSAFQDRCTHKGGSLADGVLICGRVQCLWHGSQFDVLKGQVKAGPAKEPIELYRVEERDGFVYLTIA